jgi:anti-sigma factor RsiW
VQLITDYLEGALAPRDRERFETHLESCEPCTQYVEQFRRTIAATGRLHVDDLSPETRAGLLSAFRGHR